jgi:hypothetical protein
MNLAQISDLKNRSIGVFEKLRKEKLIYFWLSFFSQKHVRGSS